MASGKLSPQSVFFDLGFAQAVVVGGDIRFQSCHLSLSLSLLKKFIQNRRLRMRAPPPRFLLKVRQTRRGKRKRAPLLNVSVRFSHSTLYHTMNMIISIQREKSVRFPGGPRTTRRRHQDAASCVSTECVGFAAENREPNHEPLTTDHWFSYPPFFNSISTWRAISFSVSNTPTPWNATDSMTGSSFLRRSLESFSTGNAFGRSRLLS
jgi:hypothetical protein